MSDFTLVAAGGLGDTFHIAGLCAAFKAQRCASGQRLVLVVKDIHRELAEMFSGYDELRTEPSIAGSKVRSTGIQPGERAIVSPHNIYVQPDQCVAYGRMTQVSMYAMMMGLHPGTKLALPKTTGNARREAKVFVKQLGIQESHTAILVTGQSWPQLPNDFWTQLAGAIGGGWTVRFNDSAFVPLRCVIPFAELCGWFIGANCGLMNVITDAQTTCRKTIITQSVAQDYSGGPPMPLPCESTYPYQYARNVSGEQYDIEEFRVEGPDTYPQVIEWIATGRNALGPRPDPRPLCFIEAPISPGELADRLSILMLKMEKMPDKAHMIRPEYLYIWEIFLRHFKNADAIHEQLAELLHHNEQGWDANQVLFDRFSRDEDAQNIETWARRAHVANQARIRIKNQINDLFRWHREYKSHAV